MLDCDGHLYMEPDVMAEIVGDAGGGWIIEYLREYVGTDADLAAREQAHDDPWKIKGISALGAFAAADRVDALDTMGIHRQLLFPNTTLRELRTHTPAALAACRRYNDYVIDWTQRADDRARAVCQINMTDHDSALAELQRVVDKGARGVLVPCAEPPGGTSPAAPAWDDFWRLLEESDTPVFIHIGAGGLASGEDDDPMLPSRQWADAPSLHAMFPDRPGGEERIGPYFIVVAHLAAESVPDVPRDGRRVRAVPGVALRRDRVRRGVAGPAVRAPRSARRAAAQGRRAVPAAAQRVHPPQRAGDTRSGPSPSTCSSSATGSVSRWCSAPTTRTSRAAAARSRASRR